MILCEQRAELSGLALPWSSIRLRLHPCQRLMEEATAHGLLAGIPSINILKPDDVIFIKIRARLNLDKEGWDFARIGESVFFTYGDVGRLIFGKQAGFLSLRHLKCSLHHDPMLRPVVMAL